MSSSLREEKDPWGKEAELIDMEELKGWFIEETEEYLVVNKPGWVVCHPSKNGPMSSLVGACREYCGVERLHLVSRLDRETSGVVVMAKTKRMASIMQQAIEWREVEKTYLGILKGELGKDEVIVQEPLARDMESKVYVKQCVRDDRTAKKAKTIFRKKSVGGGYTLAEIDLITGRKHQIRAHAQWMGNPVVGDKIYGPDEELYLEFIEQGWTERLGEALPMKRQALHAWKLEFKCEEFKKSFEAPMLGDMEAFCQEHGL